MGRDESGAIGTNRANYRLADLVPPPRKHWHRYHGVFALNHKLRPAVTAHEKREHGQAARGCDRWACGRRFASGRRPGWLSPREVRFSHTSAIRSSRHRCRPLVAHRPTGASSCRCPPSTREGRRRPTSCPPSGDVVGESATPGRQCTCPQRLWSSAREPQC